MKMHISSLVLGFCVVSAAVQAGGLGRIDPKGESRPDPRQGIERMLTLNSGVRKTHEIMLHNIRLQGAGFEPGQIERLRVGAQRQSPETAASLARLVREIVGTPAQSPNLSNVKAVAIEVLKARLERSWASELRSDTVDEKGARSAKLDSKKVAALLPIETIIARIEMIRRGVGLAGGAVSQLARYMTDSDLQDFVQRTEADLNDRIYLLRDSDPVAAQFIEDIISICPYFAEYME